MKMRQYVLVAIAVLAVAALAVAGKRISFSHSEPVAGARFLEVQADLALAETTIRAGKQDVLVQFSGRYDARNDEPTLEINRSGRKAYVRLDSGGHIGLFGGRDGDESGEFTVEISPDVELALRCDVGLGDNTIDLTGLKLQRLDIDADLSSTEIVMNERNELAADRVEIDTGLGSMTSEFLGHLRFRRMIIDAGMGDITLDLRGYEGHGTMDVSVGMGDCELILPRGLGVRVYHEKGFMSSVDLEGLEKVHEGVWESEDYDSAEHTLDIDLSVGMGSADVRWR